MTARCCCCRRRRCCCAVVRWQRRGAGRLLVDGAGTKRERCVRLVDMFLVRLRCRRLHASRRSCVANRPLETLTCFAVVHLKRAPRIASCVSSCACWNCTCVGVHFCGIAHLVDMSVDVGVGRAERRRQEAGPVHVYVLQSSSTGTIAIVPGLHYCLPVKSLEHEYESYTHY